MTELAETLSERIGRSSYDMTRFFQGMIEKGELKASSVVVDKKVIEKDSDKERVVRTIKGVTLTPTDEIRYGYPFILQTPSGCMYHLDIGSRGGMFYNDGDSQTIYDHCNLERLSKNFDTKEVSRSGNYILEKMVDGILRVSYDQDWEDDYPEGSRGSLSVEGEMDEFFERVCDFVREAA